MLFEILKAAEKVYGDRLVTVAVFGSVGRGTPRPDSDIDLLLVIEGLPNGRMKRMSEFEALEDLVEPRIRSAANEGIQTSLSPVIKTRDEVNQGSLLFLDMLEDARVMYDLEGFFAGFLERFRKRMARLGARRIWRGNAWHWVLKKDYRIGETFRI
ncbi:MAG: nucleotidyltransferase domain-containing protein [Candidatus Desulforudis sp.]|nr:nucleotidyltransferase domain-containing protein [Desulforudis sp.]